MKSIRLQKAASAATHKGSTALKTIIILLLVLALVPATLLRPATPVSAFSSGWMNPYWVSESGSGVAWSYTTVSHAAYCAAGYYVFGHWVCTDQRDAWTEYIYSVNNVTASDNQYATVILNSGQTSTYIMAKYFNFNIPASATITGIVVDIERQGDGCSGTAVMSDNEVKIIDSSGSIVGNNKATTTRYSFYGDVTESHGGTTDLWGLALSPSDVNNPNFGVAVSVKNTQDPRWWCQVSARIDHINMTVYYSLPSAMTVSSASGTLGGTVSLTATMSPAVSGESVNFSLNGVLKGSAATNSAGVATLSGVSISGISAGIYSNYIAANFSGDANYSASNGMAQLTVNNPTPTTTDISPNAKNLSDAGFTLTVNGTNFMNGAVVYLNGAARTTTFISSTRLTAYIPDSDLTRASSKTITVANPSPCASVSNAQTLTVNKPPWLDVVVITGEVHATIDVTAPANFSMTLIPGAACTSAAQSVTVKCNKAGWTLAVSDEKSTNKSYMVNGSTALTNAFTVAGGDLSGYQPLTSPRYLENGSSGAGVGITTINGITFQQTPSWNDPAGDYTITVTFTGTTN